MSIEEVALNMGVDVEALPDRLMTTFLKAIAEKQGVDTSTLSDNLISTCLWAICEGVGGSSGGADNSQFIGVLDGTLADPILPEGLTKLGDYAFYKNKNLVNPKLPSSLKVIGTSSFRDCSNLAITKLPSLSQIGDHAFNGCTNLAITELSGLQSIGGYAFSMCYGLTTITFKNKPVLIKADSFLSCTNLTTINVPWAEGAVANAPWGATNATINYNYVG